MQLSTHFTAVNDGEQLMKRLINETSELPHLLFLDLNMPRKNGFECLKEIKNNKKLENLPVVIMSTSLEQTVLDILYNCGAQYFIHKPSDISQNTQIILQTLTLIAQENSSQPTRENFVITLANTLEK